MRAIASNVSPLFTRPCLFAPHLRVNPKVNVKTKMAQNLLDMLPDELLIEIVQHLPTYNNFHRIPIPTKFLLISKHLCRLVMREQVRVLEFSTLARLSRWLDVIEANGNCPTSLVRYRDLLGMVDSLYMRSENGETIPGELASRVANLVVHCTHLRWVHVIFAREIVNRRSLAHDNLIHHSLRSLPPTVQRIKVSSENATSATLRALLDDCLPRLREAHVLELWVPNSAGVRTTRDLHDLLSLVPHLRELVIPAVDVSGKSIWDDTTLDTATQLCPFLTDLPFFHARDVTNTKVLSWFHAHSGRPTKLHLSGRNMSDAFLIEIAPHCRNIQRLLLTATTGFTLRGLAHLLVECRRVVVLYVTDSRRFWDGEDGMKVRARIGTLCSNRILERSEGKNILVMGCNVGVLRDILVDEFRSEGRNTGGCDIFV